MYIRDYDHDYDTLVDDSLFQRECDDNDRLKKKYYKRFLEYVEEYDDYFEIEDRSIIQEILNEIRQEEKIYCELCQ